MAPARSDSHPPSPSLPKACSECIGVRTTAATDPERTNGAGNRERTAAGSGAGRCSRRSVAAETVGCADCSSKSSRRLVTRKTGSKAGGASWTGAPLNCCSRKTIHRQVAVGGCSDRPMAHGCSAGWYRRSGRRFPARGCCCSGSPGAERWRVHRARPDRRCRSGCPLCPSHRSPWWRAKCPELCPYPGWPRCPGCPSGRDLRRCRPRSGSGPNSEWTGTCAGSWRWGP